MLLHGSDLNISANFHQFFLAFSKLEMLKSSIFSNFVVIFADFHEMCSDFLRFSRKMLQLLKISRFQFNFSMIIPEIHLIFDLIFDLILFNFRFNFHIGTTPRHALRGLAGAAAAVLRADGVLLRVAGRRARAALRASAVPGAAAPLPFRLLGLGLCLF